MACQKIPFPSKAEAMKAARGISRKQFGGWRRGPFVGAYQCEECSGRRAVWHMTRTKPKKNNSRLSRISDGYPRGFPTATCAVVTACQWLPKLAAHRSAG